MEIGAHCNQIIHIRNVNRIKYDSAIASSFDAMEQKKTNIRKSCVYMTIPESGLRNDSPVASHKEIRNIKKTLHWIFVACCFLYFIWNFVCFFSLRSLQFTFLPFSGILIELRAPNKFFSLIYLWYNSFVYIHKFFCCYILKIESLLLVFDAAESHCQCLYMYIYIAIRIHNTSCITYNVYAYRVYQQTTTITNENVSCESMSMHKVHYSLTQAVLCVCVRNRVKVCTTVSFSLLLVVWVYLMLSRFDLSHCVCRHPMRSVK